MILRRLRRTAGALLHDWPRLLFALGTGRWRLMRNRREKVSLDSRGVRCEWRYTTDLHVANVHPSAGKLLMRAAFRQWPVRLLDEPDGGGDPAVSFVVGHRGLGRLPLLLATLRSIAGQTVPVECIVVEQSAAPETHGQLPAWVRYQHLRTKADAPYNRAAGFNEGARLARGRMLVLHDNDIVVPAGYASEVLARSGEGLDFLELKRFLFYLDEEATRRALAARSFEGPVPASVMQNAVGGSIAVKREAYFAIGGFDEGFVGWGGEDNDFWDRARTTGRTCEFGYLPMIHLYHPPQPGKLAGDATPAVRRYRELEQVPPLERIRRLTQKATAPDRK